MTEESRHTAGGMMLGQPIGCKNKGESRVTRWRESIFLAGKPMYGRVRVARVKRVVHRRLERLVVRWHRSILQTARNVKPPEAIFMQHEGRVTRDCIKPVLVSDWAKLGGLVGREIGDVDAGPFALGLVPPNQFLAVAPRRAGRAGARSIIYDAAVARPGEAPPVSEIIFRITRVRLVNFIGTKHA